MRNTYGLIYYTYLLQPLSFQIHHVCTPSKQGGSCYLRMITCRPTPFQQQSLVILIYVKGSASEINQGCD